MENKVIAIGALGGSGTRICAQILIDSGVFMGTDLNQANSSSNDNLLFTRLFRSPRWLETADPEDIYRRLNIFQKCMTGMILSDLEKQEIIHASSTSPMFRKDSKYLSEPKFIQSRDSHFRPGIWGWKEPNTQIYIEHIAKFFPNLKYIQVIRHGLYMAFSNNIQQLINWGYKFGIRLSNNDNETTLIKKQLDYWICSNKKTIETGQRLLGSNFYTLNYDLLCKNSAKEIKKLMDFLELEISEDLMLELVAIPQNKPTNSRYLDKDLSVFTEEQIKEVRTLGFEVPSDCHL